jgi:hypothetical protein
MEKKVKKKQKKCSKSMKTIFRIEKAANDMLEEALDGLDRSIERKKLILNK